jgi:protein-L-isoaspartate(D-aspartate) O-methyltransferase
MRRKALQRAPPVSRSDFVDLEAARAAMIDSQVRPSDVTDRRLIAAMGAIPRELFVPPARRAVAYADAAIDTGPGRALMAPRDFAKLVNAAAIKETDRVLDIAPGTGYSTAVLARLAASIVALEPDEAASRTLRDNLSAVGVTEVDVVSGPLRAGGRGKGPYEVIFVNGAVEDVPADWLDQLADGGRLAVVVVEGAVRRARIYTRSGGKTAWRTPFESAAPLLPGFERAAEFRL